VRLTGERRLARTPIHATADASLHTPDEAVHDVVGLVGGIAFIIAILIVVLAPLYSVLLHRYWHGQCLGRSYLRIGLYMLMWLPWVIDTVWPLFHPERRALYDLATGTIVVPA
jgi:hypothetical protein